MDEIAKRRVEEFLAQDSLPSPHGVALAIMDIARRQDASIQDVARLVRADPAMAGRILHYANAAQHGTRHIVGVPQAVTFLGLFRVRQIVLGFSLVEEYRSGACEAFDYERYWVTSLATAIAAQKLAAVAQSPPDESFTCGLLAGIGRLGLATVFPDRYSELLRQHAPAESLLEAEKQAFGINHAELSAAMLANWGLPQIFALAVRYHEAPFRAQAEPGSRTHALTAALHFAMRIGRLLSLDDAGRWEQVPALYDAAAQAGVDQEQVAPLVEEIVDDWHTWIDQLALPSQHRFDLRSVLAAPPDNFADGGHDSALSAMRVGVAVDDPARRERLERMLAALHVRYATHADGAPAPDLVFFDVDPGAGNVGKRLCRLRDLARSGLHVVVLLPAAAEKDFPLFMDVGAMDYVVNGFTEAAIIARLKSAHRLITLRSALRSERELTINTSRQWASANRRLLHDALTDPLTQLANRRYGLDRFAQEWSVAASNALPIACMMLDIDHFKQINDRHGHDTGDLVLRQFARTIVECCRRSDVVFRYGGEEFCCICPGTRAAEAQRLAVRILEAVRDARFGNETDPLHATLSIGLAMRSADMREPSELIAAADKALYQAKQDGRDRVVSA